MEAKTQVPDSPYKAKYVFSFVWGFPFFLKKNDIFLLY